MKDFAVIGLGNFGATVARELTELGCRVTAIDRNEETVRDLQDIVHIAMVADASQRKFLENLEVSKFDGFIVSTGKESHAAILIALHLKELDAHQIIVKANSTEHARILIKVGATEAMIPEEQMAVRLSHSLAQSNLVDYLPLSADHYVAELLPPDKFIGKTLKELNLRVEYSLQVVATKNSHSGEYEYAPAGDYRIKKDDVLIILGRDKDIEKLRE